MSTVIKVGQSTRAIHQVAFNLEDITSQANDYLDKVRIQAAQIVVEAQKQADLIKKKAQDEGQKSAQTAAEKILDEKVGKRMEGLLPALKQVIAEIADARQTWLRQWENSSVKLAAKMAEKILHRELQQDPTLPLTQVRQALELAAGIPNIRILMSHQDFHTLGTQAAQITKEFNRVGNAEVMADASVKAGGCKVITANGELDLQLHAQLERIVNELTNAHEG
jgi:flagellar assembly protein FliH